MTSGLKLSGVVPVAPVAFHDDETLDLEGTRRVLDFLVDERVDGICVLANFSEQFVLSDEERQAVLDASLDAIGGRVPVIVACSHFSTRVAIGRAKAAAQAGASMIMAMPPFYGAGIQATESDAADHFIRVAEGSGLPVMIQDAPLSGMNLSVGMLADVARRSELVRHYKIEQRATAPKIRELIARGAEHLGSVLDGEEGITLMADLDAGADGSMCSAMLPGRIGAVVADHHAGNRAAALAGYEKILPIINLENRLCGLRAAKAVLQAGGVIRSDAVRHPFPPLAPDLRASLLELARMLDLPALSWGH